MWHGGHLNNELNWRLTKSCGNSNGPRDVTLLRDGHDRFRAKFRLSLVMGHNGRANALCPGYSGTTHAQQARISDAPGNLGVAQSIMAHLTLVAQSGVLRHLNILGNKRDLSINRYNGSAAAPD